MSPSLHEVRDFVTRVVASRLQGIAASEREDVCQEAWIASWQKLSCREVDDWRAYSAEIARRKASDYLSRKRVRDRYFQPMRPADLDHALDGDSVPGLELERAVFLIISYFRAHRAACADIATHRYFDTLPWEEIGRRISATTDGAKKQWERCRKFLIEHVGDELGQILDDGLDGPRGVE